MTDTVNVAALRGLLANATPGEWQTRLGDSVTSIHAPGRTIADTTGTPYWQRCSDADKANAALIVAAVNALEPLLLRLEEAQAEVERLRGLLVDPGSPAWEDARAGLVAELRKADRDWDATALRDGHQVSVPSHIALNLIAHAATASQAALAASQEREAGLREVLERIAAGNNTAAGIAARAALSKGRAE